MPSRNNNITLSLMENEFAQTAKFEKKKIVIFPNYDEARASFGTNASIDVREVIFEPTETNRQALEQEIANYTETHPGTKVIVVDDNADLDAIANEHGYINHSDNYVHKFENIRSIDAQMQELMFDSEPLPKKYKNSKCEPVRTEPKFGRNEPCRCNSGKKTKNCCK